MGQTKWDLAADTGQLAAIIVAGFQKIPLPLGLLSSASSSCFLVSLQLQENCLVMESNAILKLNQILCIEGWQDR